MVDLRLFVSLPPTYFLVKFCFSYTYQNKLVTSCDNDLLSGSKYKLEIILTTFKHNWFYFHELQKVYNLNSLTKKITNLSLKWYPKIQASSLQNPEIQICSV